MRSTATILFRPERHYRREAFAAGLRAAGFASSFEAAASPGRGDVLVLWNRFARSEPIARRYERAGARVLVAENGYAGLDAEGGLLFALAGGHHNGAGSWPYIPGRAAAQNLTLAPWRSAGEHVLVLLQRGIGEAGVAMPRPWAAEIGSWLARQTKRPVRVRMHPGRVKGSIAVPLEQDLANAWCCVTWGSGAAIKAMLAGVPVLYAFDRWIGASGAGRLGLDDIDAPRMPERGPLLDALGSAQWSLAEIASGEAFGTLLS